MVAARTPQWGDIPLALDILLVLPFLIEFAEYFTFIRNSPELRTAYTDTLGDLALALPARCSRPCSP